MLESQLFSHAYLGYIAKWEIGLQQLLKLEALK
jgi:hypothetical protein